MSGLRDFCCKGLKVAFPFLILQIVFLAPLPDAFGIDYDLAFVTKPGTANFVKPTPAPWLTNEAVVATDRSEHPVRTLWRLVSIGQKKQMLQEKKTSFSEGDDGLPAFSAGIIFAAQGSFPNASHFPAKANLHSLARKITQSKFSAQELFRNVPQTFANWLNGDVFTVAVGSDSNLRLRCPNFVEGIADQFSTDRQFDRSVFIEERKRCWNPLLN